MTEADVIQQMRRHLEGLFPRSCPSCTRRFASLRDYIATTVPLGPAMPYDPVRGDWRPLKPLGMATYANCPCGTSLVLTSAGMPLEQLWSLLAWAKQETAKRGMTPQQLLNYLRDEITRQVLSEPDGRRAPEG